MNKVDPRLEERLNLAGQEIDQLICELEDKLAAMRSLRRRLLEDEGEPVDNEQIEREVRNSNVTELAVVETQESPSTELLARKATEAMDPGAAGGTHVRFPIKHPSPGVLAHSVDASVEAQGAASTMSEATMLSGHSTSDRQFGKRDSSRGQRIITIRHPSPEAGNRSGDGGSTGGPGSPINAEWGSPSTAGGSERRELARIFVVLLTS